MFGQKANAKISENEKNWNMLLDEFGFHIADEFDLELLEGIKSGFFKEDTLQVHANKLHEQFVARDRNNDAEDSLKTAWKLYHNSFDGNEAEVIEAIFDACKKYVNFVTPTNLGGAMMLLKDLNQPEKARELLDYYIEKRSENRDLFDLEDNPFGDDISDPELRTAFVEKYASFTDTRSPHEVFIRIAKDGIWGRDDMILLSKLSKDDFYSIFKGLKGRDLSRAINRGLKIGDKDDPSEEQRKISVGIKEALTKIARESHINQRRVQQKYGVEIDD